MQWTETKIRFLRFAIWAVLMFVTSTIVTFINPYKAKYIPILFVVLIGPMVLMPLRRSRT